MKKTTLARLDHLENQTDESTPESELETHIKNLTPGELNTLIENLTTVVLMGHSITLDQLFDELVSEGVMPENELREIFAGLPENLHTFPGQRPTRWPEGM